MKKLFFFSFLSVIISAELFSQAGLLDGDFDADGKVFTDIGSFNGTDFEDFIWGIAIQPDGKIVAVGQTKNNFDIDVVIARYNTDGSLDNSFSGDGKQIESIGFMDYAARAVVIQPDGKIVITGYEETVSGKDFFVLRLNPDGTPDPAFSGDGKITTDISPNNDDVANAVALQADGKIVITGTSGPLGSSMVGVVRYMPDGTPDNSFSIDGIVTTDPSAQGEEANAIAIQPDGKIVVAGSATNLQRSMLLRYNTDGTLDLSFDQNGQVYFLPDGGASFNSMLIQPDGKIVGAGFVNFDTDTTYLLVARYLPNGALDSSFSHNGIDSIGPDPGKRIAGVRSAIALQSDGKMIIAGYQSDQSFSPSTKLARIHHHGGLDTNFGNNGNTTPLSGCFYYGLQIQSNGRIVAAGGGVDNAQYQFFVARYLTDIDLGVQNFLPGEDHLFIYPNPVSDKTALSYTLTNPEYITISLNDLRGNVLTIFSENELQSTGTHTKELWIPEYLANGIYILSISSPSGKTGIRITKEDF